MSLCAGVVTWLKLQVAGSALRGCTAQPNCGALFGNALLVVAKSWFVPVLSRLLLMLSKLAFLADMLSVYYCCRVAIEQQASLVPVLALGETLQLRNLYDMPALQQYTYKRLGFPGVSPQRKSIQT